jgi:hypothetical protein
MPFASVNAFAHLPRVSLIGRVGTIRRCGDGYAGDGLMRPCKCIPGDAV